MKLWNPVYKGESGIVSWQMINYRIDFDSLLGKLSKLDIIEIIFPDVAI